MATKIKLTMTDAIKDIIITAMHSNMRGTIRRTEIYLDQNGHVCLFAKTDLGDGTFGSLSGCLHPQGEVWIGIHEGKTQRSAIVHSGYYWNNLQIA